MIFVNHVLFFLTLIVLPMLILFDIKKIKLINDSKVKENIYYKIFILYWTITVCFLLFSSLPNNFNIKNSLDLGGVWTITAFVIGVYFFFTHLLPVILLTFSTKFRQMTASAFNARSYIFPTTPRQRKLFIIVPITVGICEEIIFRGYLYSYLQNTPYNISASISFLLVSFIFGLGHFHQGISSIRESMLFGYLLGFLYLVTGSLILPIVLHIIYDVKILYISWLLKKHRLLE